MANFYLATIQFSCLWIGIRNTYKMKTSFNISRLEPYKELIYMEECNCHYLALKLTIVKNIKLRKSFIHITNNASWNILHWCG